MLNTTDLPNALSISTYLVNLTTSSSKQWHSCVVSHKTYDANVLLHGNIALLCYEFLFQILLLFFGASSIHSGWVDEKKNSIK